MKSGAGKRKGSAFERDVCRRLSLWLSGGLRDDLLWRSAMSGGRATIQARAGKVNLAQSGDVSAIGAGAYDFCEHTFVEVKHYRELSIGRSFVCGTGQLASFWSVCCREADRYGKRPLLVARQNLYPTLAVARSRDEIFDESDPIITLHLWDDKWGAFVYLFDAVTRVRVKPTRRSPVRRVEGT